jgi:hypothetical protein
MLIYEFGILIGTAYASVRCRPAQGVVADSSSVVQGAGVEGSFFVIMCDIQDLGVGVKPTLFLASYLEDSPGGTVAGPAGGHGEGPDHLPLACLAFKDGYLLGISADPDQVRGRTFIAFGVYEGFLDPCRVFL